MSNAHRFHAPVAVHLFLLRHDRVLLLRRFGTGDEDGNYSVIAGHLNGGEEVVTAAIREAREEAGIDLVPSAVTVVGVMHRRAEQERIDFFVAATAWSGEVINREPHECDALTWVALDQLPANTIPYVRHAWENYRRGVWFQSFGWEKDDRLGGGFS